MKNKTSSKIKISIRKEWGFNPTVRIKASKKGYVRQNNWNKEI